VGRNHWAISKGEGQKAIGGSPEGSGEYDVGMNTCTRRRSVGLVAIGLMVGLAGGVMGSCSTSPWQSEYVAAGTPIAAAEYRGAVRVREVPWERVQQTLTVLQKEWAESDVPPDEWSDAQKLERKAKLLRGLQVTSDPRSVEVLGRSEFRTTDRLRPDDGELMAFAKKIGATSVVWSSIYMGKTDVVRNEPVTEYRTGSHDRWNGGGNSRTFSETSTVYVPIVVKADERAWVAYFLRDEGTARAGTGM